MTEQICILPNQIKISHPLNIAITNKAYNVAKAMIRESGRRISVLSFLRQSFCHSYFLVSTYKESLKIYIGSVVYILAIKPDGFSLVNIQTATPADTRNSITYGATLFIPGIYLSYTIKGDSDFGIYFISKDDFRISNIRNSDEIYKYCAFPSQICSAINEKINETDASKRSGDAESFCLSENFEQNYLNVAEFYAKEEDEINRNLAKNAPPLICTAPTAAEDIERIDKIAYSYDIADIPEGDIFKTGSKVELSISEDKVVTGTIIMLEASKVTILFDENISYDKLPEVSMVSLSYSDVIYKVQSDAFEKIRRGWSRAGFLDKCIGQHSPAPYSMASLTGLEKELNKRKFPPTDSQMKAIKYGISCKDIFLVQGPPGTGKTTVILEWVRYFCKEHNMKVLISSQNNKAVDNVLERFTAEEGIEAVRVGNETKIQKNVQSLLFENKLKKFREGVDKKISQNIDAIQDDMMRLNELNKLFKKWQEFEQKKALEQRTLANILKRQIAAHAIRLEGITREARQNRTRCEEIISYTLHYPGEKIRHSKWTIRKREKEYEKLSAQFADLKKAYMNEISSLITELNDQGYFPLRRNTEKRFPFYNEALPTVKNGRFFSADIIRKVIDTRSNAPIIDCRKRLDNILNILINWKNTVLSQNNYALSDALAESVNLVGATCIGINSQKRFSNVNFDVTIIDEAGQIQIQNALVAMSKSPKLIMLGDHKQIPPVANEELIERCNECGVDPRLEQISLFEDIFERLPSENKAMLDTQFRMPEEIADILSEAFYDGKYLTGKNKSCSKTPSLIPEILPSCVSFIDTSASPHKKEAALEKGYNNACEAELIASLIKYILERSDVNKKEIGVISSYAAQIALITDKLEQIPALNGYANEVAATLDSFQGQERDIIIYSFTRNNDRGSIGFMKELRRLNVALSRAKKMLILVGDISFLKNTRDDDFSNFISLLSTRLACLKGGILPAGEVLKKIKGSYYE